MIKAFQSLLEPLLAAFPGLAAEDLVFAAPPRLEVGDLCLRMFEPARKLELAPKELATTIAGSVRFGPEVQEVQTAGPYVNFKLDRGTFGKRMVEQILEEGERYGSNHSGRGRTVLIEHTSINPNASPHVGRARNAMIGDSLARLFRFDGYEVETHYYVNDMGRQIALLILACSDLSTVTFDSLLQTYVEANARAERDAEFAAQGYDLLAKMEQGDPETRKRFKTVTDLCLHGQLAVLAQIGVRYDVFDRESDYLKEPRLDGVLETLRAQGALFVDEEGRLVVDLSKIGYQPQEGRFFVLMRANGSSLYGYRDLAYTIDKMDRGADVNLIVFGEDHKLYAQQTALILQAAGRSAPEPIYYSYILLKSGKMSTRQGNVVLLSEFLDEARARVAEKVEEQCKDLPVEERKAIAHQVAVGAARFAILRVGPSKNVIFDWESSLSFTGDTGPYIQYSCARIASILRKLGALPEELPEPFPIETDAEWSLVLRLAGFPDAVAAAVAGRNCAPIAQIALDTARLFTTFYHECPVIQAPAPAQRAARAQICASTRRVLETALGLLGIEAPERM